MNYQFIKAIYDGETTIIARDELGNKVLFDPPKHRPYFYVRADEYVPKDYNVIKVESGYTGIKQNVFEPIKLKKIVMKQPSQIGEFRKNFNETWEADIPYTRRVMIDLGISCGFNERFEPTDFTLDPYIMYFDIEVRSVGFPDIDGGSDPIVSISLVSKHLKQSIVLVLEHERYVENKTYKLRIPITDTLEDVKAERYKEVEYDTMVVHFTNESELLEKFFTVIDRFFPDIISGWNTAFDIGYVNARVKYLQKKRHYNRTFDVERFWDRYLIFDLYLSYKKVFKSKPDYKLKNVIVDEELSFPDDSKKLASAINELWKAKEFDEIVEYNLKDSIFCELINDKHRIIEYYFDYKNFCGVIEMEDTLHNSIMVDTAMLRLFHNEIVFPSVNRGAKKPDDKYKGATLLPSSGIMPKGMYDNLAIYDMGKYYPSTIIAFNISPEVPPQSAKLGVIPRLCQYFIKEREKWDKILDKTSFDDPLYDSIKSRQESRKFALNSVYGVLGFYLFRLYSKKHAERVTTTCKKGILLIEKVSNGMGYQVVYGDTDSIFIKVPNLEVGRELEIILNNLLLEKFDPSGIVNLGLEAMCDPVGFIGKKKRYFYMRTWYKGKVGRKLVVKGFDFVRSDQSLITKHLQKEIFEFLLNKEYEKVTSAIRSKIKTIKDKNTDMDTIAISVGLSKKLKDYKTNVDYKRGSEYAVQHLGQQISPPCKVKMIFVRRVLDTKDKIYPSTDVVCYVEPETLPKLQIDYDRLIERTIKGKVEDLIELANVSWAEVTGTKPLSRYF